MFSEKKKKYKKFETLLLFQSKRFKKFQPHFCRIWKRTHILFELIYFFISSEFVRRGFFFNLRATNGQKTVVMKKLAHSLILNLWLITKSQLFSHRWLVWYSVNIYLPPFMPILKRKQQRLVKVLKKVVKRDH